MYLIIFLHHFSRAAISVKITYLRVSVAVICLVQDNLLTCLCSCDLSCPVLEKDNFIENLSRLIQ